MGVWGTGILDNDDALDIYSPYCSNVENELNHEESLEDLIPLLFFKGEKVIHGNSFAWLGYAKARLDTNNVDQEIIKDVQFILDMEIDFELWKDVSDVDLIEWTNAIEGLLIEMKLALND